MADQSIKARVIRSHQRDFDCLILDSKEIVKACALGNLLKQGETIVVGDFVNIQVMNDQGEYLIKEVLPRKNEIFRIIVRESKKKVTASNCDFLIILNSVSKPKFKRGIVDRFLVRAFQWDLHPIVIFNKMDNYNSDDFDIRFEEQRLNSLGVDCFEISALDPNYKNKFLKNGIEELKEKMRNKTSLFVGQSGVGKSQTITRLSEGLVVLKTKEVGKAGKGSHTTTWSEIVDCGEFDLIDSPGIRSFSLDDVDPELLIEYFPDLFEIKNKCDYSTCTHRPENKGCAFYTQETVSREDYRAIMSRLEMFLEIEEEISETPHWQRKDKYKK